MVTKRKFTREFKLSILQELESKRMAQICREHSLRESLVSKWKKDYSSNPKEAFKGNGNLWKEDAKIAQYERLVGQLYAENAFLKKVYESLKQQIAEERRKERRFS